MLDKKEKMVMGYLCKVCPQKQSCLISAQQIASALCRKYLISISELDDIMISLSKDNYIDLVVSNGKNGYYYCITLKNKARTLKNDIKKQKKEFWLVILRTLCLGALSFIVTILLKKIFKK